MKKVVVIVLIAFLAVCAVMATIAATGFRAECDELKAECELLRTENEELSEEVAESEIDTDLLPYKLFYDALVQELRGNEYDLEKAVEEYGLSDVDELILIENTEWLLRMVSVFAEE